MKDNYMKKRWVVVVASCIVNMFIGTAYCWGVFQGGLMAESEKIFGATVVASALAWAFSINTGIGPITMLCGGTMKKKFGAGGVVKVSAVLCLLGFLVTSLAKSVPIVWVGFGLIAGFGVGMINGITTTNTGLWFPEMRGTIAGLTTTFFGLGSVIFPFILRPWIAASGIMSTLRILGIIIGVVAFICGFFISAPPEGWLPDGFTPPSVGGAMPTTKNYTWKEMLADPRYWLAVIAFMCFSSAGLFVIQSGTLMSMSIGGLKEGAALVTYTVSFIGIANSGGRLLWGAISDKLGRYKSLMLMAIIVAVSAIVLGMVVNGSYGMFIIFAMLIAACYGGSMGIYPAMTADNFGPKNNGINYGVMFFGFAAGGFLGPVFFTKLMEISGGSFKMPLTVVAVLGVLALLLIAGLTKLKAGKEAQA